MLALPVGGVVQRKPKQQQEANGSASTLWGRTFAGIVLLALVLRGSGPFRPDRHLPDGEIMTGFVAAECMNTPAPSLFSTVRSGIDLPALVSRMVWVFFAGGRRRSDALLGCLLPSLGRRPQYLSIC